MKILIRKATVLNTKSPFHEKNVDILVEDSRIVKISNDLSIDGAHVIEADNLHVSLGWVDLKSDFCDPGMEHKETVESGLDAAAFGGYTHVAVLPVTQPIVDGKSQIQYMQQKADGHVCVLHPIGALTVGMKGESLAEMYDMHQYGAQLFTDDLTPVHSGIMYRGLLYARNFGGTIMAFSHNQFIAGKGMVNEGMASTKTGMKADPSIAEIIEVERNIRLVEYTQGSIHLTGVSTAESVSLIRSAKQKGLSISADVHVANLTHNETAVLDFDSNFKVMPPLRFESDRIALWQGVNDGTIDCIVTDHRPKDKEEKDLEFDLADFGNIGLQSSFGTLQMSEEFDLKSVVSALSERARVVLKIDDAPIEEGRMADLTLFQPDTTWTLDKSLIYSNTYNTPYLNKELKGNVVGVINNGKLALKD